MVAAFKLGKLRHRVRLMRDSTRMEGGQSEPTPVEIGKLWACIEPMTSRELIQVRQVLPEATHRVTTHYRKDLTADCWFEHDGRRLAIVGPPVNMQEDNTFLQCICVEQTGGG